MTVETAIQVTANINLSDQITELLSGYLVLYKEPKFAACIILAFAAAHLAHILLRAYAPHCRRVTIALGIVAVHMVVGAFLANNFLRHMPDVEFYKYFTGLNSIILYWVLIWVTTRMLKLPVLARWLSLRETEIKLVDNKPVIEFGETIKFLKK